MRRLLISLIESKALLPLIRDSLPPALKLSLFGDQSVFVTAAIKGVIIEGITAAMLTGLMILLFLGSWRSTLIIVISIPLSALASIITLSSIGQTINIMTLGGLALAVGILVDDATVAIENINWNLEQGKEVETAILDGAHQIAIPALVSTLCICIVFVPMFFLTGVARYLFVPLGEAVVFAMLASYLLSRTLIPTLANYWLPKYTPPSEQDPHQSRFFGRFHQGFEHRFEQLRQHYHDNLVIALENRRIFIIGFLTFLVISIAVLFPWLGSDFFPTVDAGQIKLHIRARVGTRVEETARYVGQIDRIIKDIIPAQDLDGIIDNVGLPVSGINLTYSNSAPVGPEDADILISLKPGHRPTEEYIKRIRAYLLEHFQGSLFHFCQRILLIKFLILVCLHPLISK